MVMIKCLNLEKKKEKNKRLKAILLRGVKLVLKCGYQSATRCSNSLHMHLGSSGVKVRLGGDYSATTRA